MGETPAQRKRREKKERRAAAQPVRQRARRRRSLRQQGRRLLYVGAVVVVAAAVAGTVWLLGADRREAADRLGDLVVEEPNLGRAHTAGHADQGPAPTSGPHAADAVCGILAGTVPPDAQIHTLEHGGIVIQYRRDDVEEAALTAVEEFARGFDEGMLVAPNPQLDAPVVVTAWTRKMRLEALDLGRLEDFTTAFRGQGPESVPCPM